MAIDLVAVAEAANGRRIATATVTARAPIAYDPYLPGRIVERATGLAETVDGDHVPWVAVVKRTEGPGLRAARRELSAYRSGLADPTATIGMRGPALLAFDEGADHVELWLEVVRDEHGGVWTPARFGVAARHIAAWAVRTGRTPLPPGFDSEDAWAERHGQPHRAREATAALEAIRGKRAAKELMALLDDPDFRRTQGLIASTAARIERLAGFPQTPLHHDLVRSNLFALSASSTAAIDWENVGRGPLGVDLAPLVAGSVRRGEASADEMTAIERLVLAGYEEGLRDAGIDEGADVRAAYRLAVGLRWHVVLGTIHAWLDPASQRIRGSRPLEPRAEALRHLVALSRHILDAGDAVAV